jgi:hypothetical protein
MKTPTPKAKTKIGDEVHTAVGQLPSRAPSRAPSRTPFSRRDATRFAAISAALLLPVYWHRRIEAGDLGSHLYNAWLAQLIRQGQAPGLWLARQWNNVLFDLLLSGLGSAFSLHMAEKIAVSFAVLIFFWGAFALIGAVARRPPWALSPLIAVFAYGWTFQMGFMNYYLSLGLCFLALALFWRGSGGSSSGGRGRLLSLALLPLMWMAHPLGVICFVALVAYATLAKTLPPRYHACLLLAAGMFLLGVRIFLASHYEVRWNPLARYLFFNGADQLALYGSRYYLLYALFAALLLAALALDAKSYAKNYPHSRVSDAQHKDGFWSAIGIPLQLYLAVAIAGLLLPTRVQLPQYAQPLSYLTPRLSNVSAILACCLLAAMKPKKWHAIASAAIAAIFFTFLYVDTGNLNKLEAQVERSVAALPPMHRVVDNLDYSEASRVDAEHIVDRACISYCLSYENYEPPSGQFRVRARPGNAIVYVEPPAQPDFATNTQSRDDQAKALGTPVFELSQCNGSATTICTRQLSPQEINDVLDGYLP